MFPITVNVRTMNDGSYAEQFHAILAFRDGANHVGWVYELPLCLPPCELAEGLNRSGYFLAAHPQFH